MNEVNKSLADGHFRKGGKLIPTFQIHRKLAQDMMENTIGVDTVDYIGAEEISMHASYCSLQDSEGRKA